MKELRVRVTFLEEALGMTCADKEVYKKYIASQAPNAPSRAEEVEALGEDEVFEKSTTTIFPRDEQGRKNLLGLPDQRIFQWMLAVCSVRYPVPRVQRSGHTERD